MHWLFRESGLVPTRRLLRGFGFAGAVFLLCAGLASAQTPAPSRTSAQSQASRSDQSVAPAASAYPEDSGLEKAQSLMQAGKLQAAENVVREALKTAPNSGAAHFLLGYILFSQVQAQAKQVDSNPNAVYAAPSKSLVELRERNAKESLAEYTAGARYHRPNAFDLKVVAMDYIMLGDFVDADKWLRQSLEWNPGDSDGWYELGRTKYNENRFSEAIDAFKKCLAVDSTNVKAEVNLGLSYAGLGNDPQAISAYQTAIAWQASSGRKDPEAYLGLGSLLLNQNRPKDAIPVLSQATQIAPSVSQGHELLGKAYSQVDELAKAQSELEQAVKLSPDTPRLHYMLGQVYRKQGHTAEAKAEFDRCAALEGTRSSDPGTM